ncbi:MAG: twin-arginine translocase TatA/TatE family subunit [Solirubrobacterales bacterium]
MPSIGPLELGIVLVIILLIFGPKRLPGLGKQLGSGMREFKESITGRGGKDDEETPKVDAAKASEPEAPAQPAEKSQAAPADGPRADS